MVLIIGYSNMKKRKCLRSFSVKENKEGECYYGRKKSVFMVSLGVGEIFWRRRGLKIVKICRDFYDMLMIIYFSR